MLSEEETKKTIKNYPIKTLTAGVQKFWNGPSCAVMIENSDNLVSCLDYFWKIEQ